MNTHRLALLNITTPQARAGIGLVLLCLMQLLCPALSMADEGLAATALNADKGHTTPMLRLGSNQLPMTEIIKSQEKENFYNCQGVVSNWFLSIVSEEMNYFAAQSKLVGIDKTACIISIENGKSLTPGLITIRLYQTIDQLKDCIDKHRCKIERNVTLQVKHNQVYRSYFLTDLNTARYIQHCVSNEGKWFKNTNCYQVD
jgi:hypothetical protein